MQNKENKENIYLCKLVQGFMFHYPSLGSALSLVDIKGNWNNVHKILIVGRSGQGII